MSLVVFWLKWTDMNIWCDLSLQTMDGIRPALVRLCAQLCVAISPLLSSTQGYSVTHCFVPTHLGPGIRRENINNFWLVTSWHFNIAGLGYQQFWGHLDDSQRDLSRTSWHWQEDCLNLHWYHCGVETVLLIKPDNLQSEICSRGSGQVGWEAWCYVFCAVLILLLISEWRRTTRAWPWPRRW